MKTALSILEGPADCGNMFGYWKAGFIPEGKFAVVSDGEYANGGHGPSVECVRDSREEAEAAMRRMEALA